MMMITSDPMALTFSLLAGLAAGALFFAGLRLTVERITAAKHPAALAFFSFAVRAALVLGAFFFAGRDHLDRILMCLLGFLVARFIVLRVTRPGVRKEVSDATES